MHKNVYTILLYVKSIKNKIELEKNLKTMNLSYQKTISL